MVLTVAVTVTAVRITTRVSPVSADPLVSSIGYEPSPAGLLICALPVASAVALRPISISMITPGPDVAVPLVIVSTLPVKAAPQVAPAAAAASVCSTPPITRSMSV